MKFIFFILFFGTLLIAQTKQVKYVANSIPPNMTTQVKKERFFYLVVPAVQKVHAELMQLYNDTKTNIELQQNLDKITQLKKEYNAKSDLELLMALKPHPQSITIAQAAMESAWATSRFFTQANNLFGMWSYNSKEPRIAASEQRDGKKTIWLKKFPTIEDSIRAYYKLMGRGYAYKEFRELRYKTDDVFTIIQALRNYSEKREEYVNELASIIRYNKLTKYDNLDVN